MGAHFQEYNGIYYENVSEETAIKIENFTYQMYDIKWNTDKNEVAHGVSGKKSSVGRETSRRLVLGSFCATA